MNSELYPKTYIISIAVSNYNSLKPLPNAIKDSDAIVSVLDKKYKISNLWQLHEDDFNENKIFEVFRELKEVIKKKDSLLVFYNGHGAERGNRETIYWPYKNSTDDPNEKWYRCLDLFHDISELSVKHVGVFINSCYSGSLFSQPSVILNTTDDGGGMSRILFTSGRKYQTSQDSSNENADRSPFIGAIVNILEENNDKYKLSLRDVISYTIAVFEKSTHISNPRDGYFTGHEGGEFYLYLRKDEAAAWKEIKNEIESYDSFLAKFPDGKLAGEAEEKKSKLIKEQTRWYNTVTTAYNVITEFISEANTRRYKEQFIAEGRLLLEEINNSKSKIRNIQDIEKAWKNAKALNKIDGYDKFRTRFKNSKYETQAVYRKNKIIGNKKDEKAWSKIPNKRTNIRNRLNAYKVYLIEFKFGNQRKEAGEKIRDIGLYVEVEEAIEAGKSSQARSLLKRYLDDSSNTEYRKKAKKELEKLSIEAHAMEIKLRYEEALEQNNISELYSILENIKGIRDEQEREANEETYQLAKLKIAEFERERQEAYDTVIAKESIMLMVEFRKKYREGELVEEVKALFNKKDRETYDYAEYSKKVIDFQYYIDEFKDYEGVFIGDAEGRIEEITFFNTLSRKQELRDYLHQPNIKRVRLMKEEAEQQIQAIEYNEEKMRRYDEVMKAKSIDLCQKYMDDYDKDIDDKWNSVKAKSIELNFLEKEERMFKEIEQMKDYKIKLNLCNLYENRFKNGKNKIEVIKIKTEVQEIIKEEADFEEAKRIRTVDSFRIYKDLHGQGINVIKADDYIMFLEAKATHKVKPLEDYVEKYKDIGENLLEAKDCILFLKAKESNEIPPLQDYLDNPFTNLYTEEAKKIIQQLQLEIDENEAFITAKDENTSDSYFTYLIGEYPKKPHNEAFAKKRRRELLDIEKEKKRFVEVELQNDEDSYLDYIQEYGKKGVFYKKATKSLREKQLGITEKDLDMSSKIENNTLAISELAKNMQNVSDSINQMTQTNNKKLNIFICLIFIVFILLMLFWK